MLPDLQPFVLSTPPPRRLRLAANEVHIWCAFADAFEDERTRTHLADVLAGDERARMQRFIRARDRHLQLISRAMIRTLLSAYTGVRPDAWQFGVGAHGKPVLVQPTVDPPIGFNLSHTHGLVVGGFSRGAEIGVDVEWLDRRTTTTGVARRFFAPSEVARLETIPDASRVEAFFAFWTLKEAYLKARGLGLSVPLSSFAFDLDPEGPRVLFEPPPRDDASSWQFARYAPGPRHRLAVAVRRPPGTSLRIRVGSILPR